MSVLDKQDKWINHIWSVRNKIGKMAVYSLYKIELQKLNWVKKHVY